MDSTKTALPQYKKLYEVLRKNIIDGVFLPGDLLPSENELCKIHGITRPTVRQALTALVNDGYIIKQKGKGSIVSMNPKNIGIMSIQSTTSAVGNQNLKTQIIKEPEIKEWPEEFPFDVPEEYKGIGCIHFERLRLVNEIPVFYDISYLPNLNLPRFTSRSIKDKSLFDVLRSHYQIEVKGGLQQLKAIAAQKPMDAFLKVKKGHPLLNLERSLETNRVGFHFYSIIFCNTEKFSLSGSF